MTRHDVFKALTPDQIAAYLTAHDWREVEPQLCAAVTTWTCPAHDPPHETDVPKSITARDRVYLVDWCLTPIAKCEGRPTPAEQVAAEIAEATL